MKSGRWCKSGRRSAPLAASGRRSADRLEIARVVSSRPNTIDGRQVYQYYQPMYAKSRA